MNEDLRDDVDSGGDARLSQLLAHVIEQIERVSQQGLQSAPGRLPDVLAHNRLAVYCAMDEVGSWINRLLAEGHAGDEVLAAREQVVSVLRPLSATGPFFDRSYGKLRGYPGDFETIEIIYRCRPSGATLAALILDDYYLHTLAAQAVRNRLAYLVQRLRQEIQRRSAPGAPTVRLLSLGSGSARELVMLAKEPALVNAVHVTCLDLDAEALRFARDALAPHYDGRVTFVKGNALDFATGAGRLDPPYHVIYAAGLFDYLKESQARHLIQDCYERLAPGGTLIVGNFSVELPPNERILIEWLLEWRLLYRNEGDYGRIAAGTSFDSRDLKFDYEPLHANLFAILRK